MIMNSLVVAEQKTADMGLAASCFCEGIRYLRVEKDPDRERRLFFVFESTPEIARIETERANGTHVVSSTSYDEALRKLKTIIHSTI
jgi:hypothetical protein